MTLLNTRFGIDDFILEMMRVPPERLQLRQLHDWVASLDLKDDLFRQHIAFCRQTYRRQLLCRTPRFDLLILCWQPGQCSTVHDHADSLNVTRVYRGVLTSRSFCRAPLTSAEISADRCCRSSLQLQQENHLPQGELATVERHQIHQLANTSDDNLVTLHVYARPLQQIQVYCPRSGQARSVPVQYELDA